MPSTARSRGRRFVEEGHDTGPERSGERRHGRALLDRGPIEGGRDAVGVGLNPFRETHRSPADYVMVAVAVVVCLALVAWALFG